MRQKSLLSFQKIKKRHPKPSAYIFILHTRQSPCRSYVLPLLTHSQRLVSKNDYNHERHSYIVPHKCKFYFYNEDKRDTHAYFLLPSTQQLLPKMMRLYFSCRFVITWKKRIIHKNTTLFSRGLWLSYYTLKSTVIVCVLFLSQIYPLRGMV